MDFADTMMTLIKKTYKTTIVYSIVPWLKSHNVQYLSLIHI